MPLMILVWLLSSLLVGQALAQADAPTAVQSTPEKNNPPSRPTAGCASIEDPVAKANCLIDLRTSQGSSSGYNPSTFDRPPPDNKQF